MKNFALVIAVGVEFGDEFFMGADKMKLQCDIVFGCNRDKVFL